MHPEISNAKIAEFYSCDLIQVQFFFFFLSALFCRNLPQQSISSVRPRDEFTSNRAHVINITARWRLLFCVQMDRNISVTLIFTRECSLSITKHFPAHVQLLLPPRRCAKNQTCFLFLLFCFVFFLNEGTNRLTPSLGFKFRNHIMGGQWRHFLLPVKKKPNP